MALAFRPNLDKASEQQYLLLLTNIHQYADVLARLGRQLVEFPSQLDEAIKHFEFVDRALAESLLATASQLLAYCVANPGAEAVPFVLAAIDYFLCANDAQPDFAEIDGFEDDRKVIAAVIDHFQLQSHIKMQLHKRGA